MILEKSIPTRLFMHLSAVAILKNGKFFHIPIIHKILSMIYMKVLGSLIQQMKLSLSAGRMDMETVMSGILKLMLLVKLY